MAANVLLGVNQGLAWGAVVAGVFRETKEGQVASRADLQGQRKGRGAWKPGK